MIKQQLSKTDKVTNDRGLDVPCPVCGRESLYEINAYRCACCNIVADELGLSCERCGSTMFMQSLKSGDIVCISKGCGYSMFRRMKLCSSLESIRQTR